MINNPFDFDIKRPSYTCCRHTEFYMFQLPVIFCSYFVVFLFFCRRLKCHKSVWNSWWKFCDSFNLGTPHKRHWRRYLHKIWLYYCCISSHRVLKWINVYNRYIKELWNIQQTYTAQNRSIKKRNLYDDGPQKEHKLLCFSTDKNTERFYWIWNIK